MPATTSQPEAGSSLAALAKASELNAQSSPPASPVVRKLSVFAGKAGFVFAEAPALAGPLPSCPAISSSRSCPGVPGQLSLLARGTETWAWDAFDTSAFCSDRRGVAEDSALHAASPRASALGPSLVRGGTGRDAAAAAAAGAHRGRGLAAEGQGQGAGRDGALVRSHILPAVSPLRLSVVSCSLSVYAFALAQFAS